MPSDELKVLGNRELELELIRARQSAQAARMEARAAEIELMLLAQLRGSGNHSQSDLPSPVRVPGGAFAPATLAIPSLREQFHDHDPPPAAEMPFPNADPKGQRRAADELLAAIQRLISARTTAGMPAWISSTPTERRSQDLEASADGWGDRLRALQFASRPDSGNVVTETQSPATLTRSPGRPESTESLPIEKASISDAIANPTVAADSNGDRETGVVAARASVGLWDETSSKREPGTPICRESTPAPLDNLAPASCDSRVTCKSSDQPVPPGGSLAPSERTLPLETEVDRQFNISQRETEVIGSSLLPDTKPGWDGAGLETVPQEPRAGTQAAAGIAPTATSEGRRRGIVARPVLPEGIRFAEASDAPPVRRLRPAAWMVSVATHVGFVAALAALTLSMPQARDQLAFSASATQTTESSVETFTLEPVEEVTESLETTQEEEPLAETSPLGEVAISEVAVDVAAATAPGAAAPSGAQAADLASSQLTAASENRVQFAGVDGGGNHFVYLVDSSNSMRNFNEARQELLRSVEALQADQRFYVIFYDEMPAMMRLTAANEDEPTSVLATAENKLALRRWAMTIGQEKGRSPIETLEFAFQLEPDVIFLLSDGEFSAATEEVIQKSNRHENLFGESQLVSIIHTIRYPGHSNAGVAKAEIQMRRIAENNGGQYRNVEIR